MKRLVVQTLWLILLVLVSFAGILALAGGSTDAFYWKFATPRQSNMIVGTSRAAQGVQPAVLDSLLGRSFFNYAFTAEQSPYGPVYVKSIQKKVDSAEKNGLFILTVDPWSIASTSADPNDSLHFREAYLHLNDIENVTAYPNWKYLFKYLKGNYYSILLNPLISSLYLHRDGWLEVSVPMDTSHVRQRTQSKMESYRRIQHDYRFSEVRLASLKKLVHWLNQHGRVYLVRLPVPSAMLTLEQELMPNFDEKMQEIAPLTAGYLDMTVPPDEGYLYTDGNHLFKSSARQVSSRIGRWVATQEP